ncbi:hypothetical protein ACIBIZ_28205 [Nonomuraea spiralis]|uniref:hypothetical protein n=1 Tax=Nonomuraea TaxID=83681 RepID=UPI000F77607A|nr:hypothetical protein [Nonomuraea sp. WAC 01424]RSN15820.1 hypothetical protein DMB42_03280 [Nonomuraea sp. WAC 01424]
MTSRRVVVAAGAAVGVLAVAVAGWLWLRPGEPRPAAFHGEPTSAFYAAVDSRQADAAPLTAQEVFTAATANLGSLRRTSTQEHADCDEILWGAPASGCTQALGAAYAGNGLAGQFAIFNLPDGRAADALVNALGKDGFVRQDAAFDAARSRAQARAMGHYVTVSWVGGTASADDLVTALVALDGLGRVVQNRILAAT